LHSLDQVMKSPSPINEDINMKSPQPLDLASTYPVGLTSPGLAGRPSLMVSYSFAYLVLYLTASFFHKLTINAAETARTERHNPLTDCATTPYSSSSGWDTREGSTMADAVESEGNQASYGH
jgi:hypothetical protein